MLRGLIHEPLEARQLLAVDAFSFPPLGLPSSIFSSSPATFGAQGLTGGRDFNYDFTNTDAGKAYSANFDTSPILFWGPTTSNTKMGLSGQTSGIAFTVSELQTTAGFGLTPAFTLTDAYWIKPNIPIDTLPTPGMVTGRLHIKLSGLGASGGFTATLPTGTTNHLGVVTRVDDPTFSANFIFEVYNSSTSSWNPAIEYYNAASTTPSGGTQLNFSSGFATEKDPILTATGSNSLSATVSGGDVVVTDGASETYRFPIATKLTSLTLNGANGDNSISVGDIPSSLFTTCGISVSGGSGTDKFTINNNLSGVSVAIASDVEEVVLASDFQGTFTPLPSVGIVTVSPGGVVQQGISIAASTATVNVRTGSYNGDIDLATPAKNISLSAGASPGQVTVMGAMTLNAGDALNIELAGTNP